MDGNWCFYSLDVALVTDWQGSEHMTPLQRPLHRECVRAGVCENSWVATRRVAPSSVIQMCTLVQTRPVKPATYHPPWYIWPMAANTHSQTLYVNTGHSQWRCCCCCCFPLLKLLSWDSLNKVSLLKPKISWCHPLSKSCTISVNWKLMQVTFLE